MSALGQKQTCAAHKGMSALPLIATAKADILPNLKSGLSRENLEGNGPHVPHPKLACRGLPARSRNLRSNQSLLLVSAKREFFKN